MGKERRLGYCCARQLEGQDLYQADDKTSLILINMLNVRWKSWDSIIGTIINWENKITSGGSLIKTGSTEAYEILPECSLRFYFSMQITFYKFVVRSVILGFVYLTPQYS